MEHRRCCERITQKLISRHDYVFGDAAVADPRNPNAHGN